MCATARHVLYPFFVLQENGACENKVGAHRNKSTARTYIWFREVDKDAGRENFASASDANPLDD